MVKKIIKTFFIVFSFFLIFYFFANPNYFLSTFLKPKNCFEENFQLKKQVAFLEAENFQLSQKKKDWQKIKDSCQIIEKEKYKTAIANVIANSPFNFQQFIIINLGKKDGIKKGMPVVLTNPFNINKKRSLILFGLVSEVSYNRAKVLTIFNKNFTASAFVYNLENKKVVGLIKGGGDKITFNLVPQKEKISQNNLVFTTGFDNKFPAGLYIGKINSIKDEGGVFKNIRISLPYNWYEVSKVLVVLSY